MIKIKKLINSSLNQESKFLFKRLIILMILDAFSTILLLETGCGIESNPVTNWFHLKFEVVLGQLLNTPLVDIPGYTLIAGIVGLYYEYTHRNHRKIARVLSYGILISFGYVVLGNLLIIYNCLL